MRPSSPLLLTALLISFVAPTIHASPFDPDEDYVGRLIFGCSYSRNNDHGAKIIGGVSAGGFFGENGNHETNIEILLSAWQTSRYDLNGDFICKITESHIPVLLNYRYYFRVPKTPVAFHAGGGIGCDIISNSYKPGKEHDVWDEDSTWLDHTDFSFAACATAGIVLRCGKNFGLEFTYRCMWQSGSGYMGDTTVDGTHNTPRVRMGTRPDIIHMLTAGISFAY